MHRILIAYYDRLCTRRTFRSDDIVTVFGLFFGAAITGPIEVHVNRARTGQILSRDTGAGMSRITHIDQGIII